MFKISITKDNIETNMFMKYLFVLIIFSGCSHLVISKDCEKVENKNLSVCKSLWFWE